jgi:hypothetical protein
VQFIFSLVNKSSSDTYSGKGEPATKADIENEKKRQLEVDSPRGREPVVEPVVENQFRTSGREPVVENQ